MGPWVCGCIVLHRTPYNAAARAQRTPSPHMLALPPEGDEVFVKAGYIRVFQDVRGKYGSEGEYVMTRPACSAAPTKASPS
jgi:uncharacterized protein